MRRRTEYLVKRQGTVEEGKAELDHGTDLQFEHFGLLVLPLVLCHAYAD